MTLVIASILVFASGQTPPTSAYFPPNLYLVRAKTESVKDLGYAIQGQFVVTEVYLGPEQLKGKKFDCRTSMPFGGFVSGPRSMDVAVQLIEKDVEGLWWLYHDSKADVYRPELREKIVNEWQIRNHFPIQKHRMQWADCSGRPIDVEALFKEALANWAVPAECFAKAKSDDDRLAMLNRLAADPKAPAAPWAASLIGHAGSKEALAVLQELSRNEKISLNTQYALDEALCKRDPSWHSSGSRKRMLQNWLDEANLTTSATARLSAALADNQLDFATYIALWEACFAKRDKYSNSQQDYLMRLIPGSAVRRPEDKPALFLFLTGLLRKADTGELQYHASHRLQYCRPLGEKEKAVVRELRDKATDRRAIENLDQLLK